MAPAVLGANPARSFGPALVGGDFSSFWVYVAGPLAGSVIAVGVAYILRGRGGDPIARAAGSGVLTPGRVQEKAQLAHDIEAGHAVLPGIATQEPADSSPAAGTTGAASAPEPNEPNRP